MFTATFLKNEGISALANLIPQCTGNTLAYCLDSLDTCMNYGMGWQNVDQNVVSQIVSALESENLNSKKVCYVPLADVLPLLF